MSRSEWQRDFVPTSESMRARVLSAQIEPGDTAPEPAEPTDLATMRRMLSEIQAAEKIDAGHGFQLPGDSALYITLWGWESLLGELDRAPSRNPPQSTLNPDATLHAPHH